MLKNLKKSETALRLLLDALGGVERWWWEDPSIAVVVIRNGRRFIVDAANGRVYDDLQPELEVGLDELIAEAKSAEYNAEAAAARAAAAFDAALKVVAP